MDAKDKSIREFIFNEFDDLLADLTFVEQLPWHLSPDESNQRCARLIIGRMRNLAGL